MKGLATAPKGSLERGRNQEQSPRTVQATSERFAYDEVPHLTAKLVSHDGAFDLEQEEDRGGL